MSGLRGWPIVVGILIDIGGSIGAGIAYVIGAAVVQGARGVAFDAETLTLGVPQLAVIEMVGLLFTATGGFVAAQMAKTRHLHHGMAVGVASLCVGLLSEFAGGDSDVPAWFNAIAYVAVVPAAAFGGYLAGRGART